MCKTAPTIPVTRPATPTTAMVITDGCVAGTRRPRTTHTSTPTTAATSVSNHAHHGMANSQITSATTNAAAAVHAGPHHCRAPSNTSTTSVPAAHSHGTQSPDTAYAVTATTAAAVNNPTCAITPRRHTSRRDGPPPPSIP